MQTRAVNWLGMPRSALEQSRGAAIVAALVLTVFIGIFDYATGAQISLSAFYLIPVTIAAWYVGFAFALVIAAACVGVWATGNVVGGDDEFATPFLVTWNCTVQFASYFVVVVAVTRIHSLQKSLEERVRERAAALTREVRERELLQRELLQVSEREQRRIGQDLHDGLCQHLAGTAMAGQVLREKLARQRLSEAADAQRVVELIQEGVVLSRSSAKGLHPVEFDAGGLMLALEELADTTSKLFKVACRFECESPVLVRDREAAEHMYRIVQEAVRNAISHGRAANIAIRLEAVEDGQELRIEDDGRGMPAAPSREGMGLRIMQNRALVIGGRFRIDRREGGGTIVCCSLPYGAETEEAAS
jgi:signal transduction histidine kinase